MTGQIHCWGHLFVNAISKRDLKRILHPGAVFHVDGRDGGAAYCVVAACDLRGLVIGRLFREADVSSIETLDTSLPNIPVRFGDLHIREGKWKPAGVIRDFNIDEWRVKYFRRKNVFGQVFVTTYGDHAELISEVRVSESEAEDLPDGAGHGAGAIEILISQWFC